MRRLNGDYIYRETQGRRKEGRGGNMVGGGGRRAVNEQTRWEEGKN